MRPVQSVDPDSLRWLRSNDVRHEFDLAAESDVVATLRWKSSVGSLAVAESTEGSWSLKRSGFLNPRVTVRDAKTATEAGQLLSHGSHGMWVPTAGDRLDWRRTSLLVPGWHFQDAQNHEILAFEPVREKLRLEGALLTIPTSNRGRPDLVMLLVVGFYFIALAWLEDEAAAASDSVLNATVGP